MSRYDGLIIPRSYSEYINKTDAATLQQALQLSGVLSGAVAAGDNKAITSSAVNNALSNYLRSKYISRGGIADKDLLLLRIKKGNQNSIGYTSFMINGVNAFGVEQALIFCNINSRRPPENWLIKPIFPLLVGINGKGGTTLFYSEDSNNYYVWLKLPDYYSNTAVTVLNEERGDYIFWEMELGTPGTLTAIANM